MISVSCRDPDAEQSSIVCVLTKLPPQFLDPSVYIFRNAPVEDNWYSKYTTTGMKVRDVTRGDHMLCTIVMFEGKKRV